jgi:CubicO group peptidase (beta-lactamase class C family)
MTPPNPALGELLEQLIVQPGVAPGATAAVAKRGPQGWQLQVAAVGTLGPVSPSSPMASVPVQVDTLYDLASVTKPVVALLCARLAAIGTLPLSTPLGAWVAEARNTPSEHLSLETLLSHRAGLLPHLDLFEPLRRREQLDPSFAVHAAASARRSECGGELPVQGFPPLYSDLGYLLVGEAVQRATRRNLDELIDEHVNQPCGTTLCSASQWRTRDPGFPARVAPTEWVAWRGGFVHGIVHDENAWALARQGCAGNAGLFADAANVAQLGMAVLDALAGRRRDFLTRKDVALLVQPRAGGTLRAGFDGKSAEGSSAGTRFGPHSFGHLGFTGTSLWCDPDADVVVVVLSNRVSPTRDNVLHRQYRPLLSDALFLLAQQA